MVASNHRCWPISSRAAAAWRCARWRTSSTTPTAATCSAPRWTAAAAHADRPVGGRVQRGAQPRSQRLLPGRHYAARVKPGAGVQPAVRGALRRRGRLRAERQAKARLRRSAWARSAWPCVRSSLTVLDNEDSSFMLVAAGKQISVTLHTPAAKLRFGPAARRPVGRLELPARALVDESVSAHQQQSVQRQGLHHGGGALCGHHQQQPAVQTHGGRGPCAPPPPPPPPPPPDACVAFDAYDVPRGAAGNWSQSQATLIGFNTPITAALCYAV